MENTVTAKTDSTQNVRNAIENEAKHGHAPLQEFTLTLKDYKTTINGNQSSSPKTSLLSGIMTEPSAVHIVE